MEPKRYETIWITEPSHKFDALKMYAQKLRFITTGYEDINQIEKVIELKLQEFNPMVDAIVLTGKNTTNFFIGKELGQLFDLRQTSKNIFIGLYVKNEKGKRVYEFKEVVF